MSTGAIALSPARAVPVRRALIVATLLSLPAVFWGASQLRMEPVVGCVLLVGAAIVFRHAAIQRFGTSATALGLFFAIAIGHAVFGFLMAAPTAGVIWIGTAADRVYATAFLVVSTGLLATAAGYALWVPHELKGVQRRIASFRVREQRLVAIARVIAICGAAVMIAVYASVGFLPMLIGVFSGARYLTALSDDFAIYEWVAARALDLLTFATPIVVTSALWRHRKLDWGIGALAGFALLLPLRRANLLTVIFIILIAGAMRSGKASLKRLAGGGFILLLYLLSQVLFVSLANVDRLSVEQIASISGGALPEIRDLGWTIELIGDERLNGMTFAQAVVPIPSFSSDVSQKYSLRAVTSRLIGLDMDRRTGGLRLTLPGEAYLNFDLFGPVVMGVLFGMLCAFVELTFRELRQRREQWSYITAAFLFVWTCFWLYLGGTQSAATLKMGAVLLAGSLWFSRKRDVDVGEGITA